MKIAWIGTGVMGRPMALHLANAGYSVNAFNRTHTKVLEMGDLVNPCSTIEDAVKDADIIFTIVGFPKDVEDVYHEIFRHAKKGSICLDMTTSSPTLAVKLSEQAHHLGISFLDAPVTGGDLGAINGTLSIMVGGRKETYDHIRPLLQYMGKTINYMGHSGAGQHAKLANQIAIAGSIAGCAEALIYADAKGINMETMLSVITGGSASSWQAVNNGPKMITKDFKPGFFLKHFLKDLNLVLDEKNDLYLPTVTAITKIYEVLSSHGYDDMGTQAIIDYYTKNL